MSDMAIALMYYGFPEKREEMPEYLRDILHGKEPPNSLIEENLRKLDIIGGKSPSKEIVRKIRDNVETKLAKEGFEVYLLTKHHKPSLKDAKEIIREKTIFEVPLFPVYSRYIFDGYFGPFESQFSDRKMIRVFNLGFEKELIEHYSGKLRGASQSIMTFSAHSIPITGTDDPYPVQIQKLSEMIANGKGFINIYHSQGLFHSKWLTPTPDFAVAYAKENEFPSIRVVPIGFIYDHIEVLYDLDFRLKNMAEEAGISYERLPLPNDSDQVTIAIANAIERARS